MQRLRLFLSESLLYIVVLIWGVNFTVVKAVLATVHPHVFNALRLTLAAAVLGLLYYTEQRRKHQRFFDPLRSHWRMLVLLGVLGYAVYQALFIVGVDLTTTGNAALIMASVPLWVAAISLVSRIEQVSASMWIGIVITLVGTVIVLVSGSERYAFGTGTWQGNLVILFAAFAWSLFTTLNKPLLAHIRPLALTFWGLVFSLPFLYGIAAPYTPPLSDLSLSLPLWLSIAYSGALSSGIAVMWWNRSVGLVGPSRTAVVGNLVPLITLITSYFVLGEPITLAHLIGGGLIIGGILYMRRR